MKRTTENLFNSPAFPHYLQCIPLMSEWLHLIKLTIDWPGLFACGAVMQL